MYCNVVQITCQGSRFPPAPHRPVEILAQAQRGGRRHGYYKVEVADGDHVTMPGFRVTGRQPGPATVIVAGLHGDEYEGMEAVRRLIGAVDTDSLAGTVVAFPQCNPLALTARSRTTPASRGGRNLAREFPGDAAGDPTRRIAAAIWEMVTEACTADGLVIDLHSGGQHFAYASLAGVRDVAGPAGARARLAARAMMLDNLWLMDATPGTLTTEASQAGLPAVGCEVTGRGGMLERDVQKYVDGLLNVLRLLEQLHDDRAPTLRPDGFRSAVTVTSGVGGFCTTLPALHARVARSDLLADVVSPLGERLATVVSPVSGTVWAARACPHLDEGDIVALVASDEQRENGVHP
jgi:predicted deacylase